MIHPTHNDAGKRYACGYPDGIPDNVPVSYGGGCRGCALMMVARARRYPDAKVRVRPAAAKRYGFEVGQHVPIDVAARLAWDEVYGPDTQVP